jgi:hypothetical protein
MNNCIIEIVNYFNPFSHQFKSASKDYSDLTLNRKVLAVAAGIFGGLFTPFLLFTGSFAGFQFTVKWLRQGDNTVADCTQQTAKETGVFSPLNTETDSLDTSTPDEPVNTAVREFGPNEQLGEFTGVAKKICKDGDIYIGQIHQGSLQGIGKLTSTDGSVYEGQFHQGNFEGIGKITFEEGKIYEGQFKQGDLHGQGKVTHTDGTIYEGQFRHGAPYGQIKVSLENGEIYEGTIINGSFKAKKTTPAS